MNTKVSGRDLIHIISKHSQLSSQDLQRYFTDRNIYADRTAWTKFIDRGLMGIGIVFAAAGVIFFFAYNWQDMHRFVKLGLVELLVVTAVGISIFCKFDQFVKDLILFGASLLTGALFSVFGQIYQTGANAYDFFLGWTCFITLWVLVSRFALLWLLWVFLLNITLVFYSEQVAKDWPAALVYCILYGTNSACLIVLGIPHRFSVLKPIPKWFSNILAMTAACCSTISIISGILYRYDFVWFISLLIVSMTYTAAVIYSFKSRIIFYLFIVPLSTIIIISAFLIDTSKGSETAVFFIVSLFIITSITVLIKQILKLNRIWNER